MGHYGVPHFFIMICKYLIDRSGAVKKLGECRILAESGRADIVCPYNRYCVQTDSLEMIPYYRKNGCKVEKEHEWEVSSSIPEEKPKRTRKTSTTKKLICSVNYTKPNNNKTSISYSNNG